MTAVWWWWWMFGRRERRGEGKTKFPIIQRGKSLVKMFCTVSRNIGHIQRPNTRTIEKFSCGVYIKGNTGSVLVAKNRLEGIWSKLCRLTWRRKKLKWFLQCNDLDGKNYRQTTNSSCFVSRLKQTLCTFIDILTDEINRFLGAMWCDSSDSECPCKFSRRRFLYRQRKENPYFLVFCLCALNLPPIQSTGLGWGQHQSGILMQKIPNNHSRGIMISFWLRPVPNDEVDVWSKIHWVGQ